MNTKQEYMYHALHQLEWRDFVAVYRIVEQRRKDEKKKPYSPQLSGED